MSDKQDVGRTNLIILCFGLFACVALSLMMQHVASIQTDGTQSHPIVRDLHGLFGEHLAAEPRLVLTQRENRQVAILTIIPKPGQDAQQLARTVGRYVVHFRDESLQFDAMEVIAKDDAASEGEVIPIRVPPRGVDQLRRVDSSKTGSSGRSDRPPAGAKGATGGTPKREANGEKPKPRPPAPRPR